MTERSTPIARVALARSLPRMMALPVVLFAAAGAGIAAGLIVVPPPSGFALVAVGAVLGLLGLALMIVALSVRLDVEESAIRVSWIGGGRRYLLSPGPVTRVRLSGQNASRLRMRSGVPGWGLGQALLRGEETIRVVRLAPTATAILVPTDGGRLAIAPTSDDALLDALSRAARARHRLEARAVAAPAEPAPEAPAEPPSAAPSAAIEAREVAEPSAPMTGIERARLEERLARERADAGLAAAAVQTAPAEAAGVTAATVAAAESVSDVAAPAPVGAEVARPVAVRRRRVGIQRPGTRAAFVFLPLVGAGIAWGIGLATGRMPEPGTDLARLTSLALVMAGPATSVGALMALAWWPRLVGVVVTGGLAASVFIGRALIGP